GCHPLLLHLRRAQQPALLAAGPGHGPVPLVRVGAPLRPDYSILSPLSPGTALLAGLARPVRGGGRGLRSDQTGDGLPDHQELVLPNAPLADLRCLLPDGLAQPFPALRVHLLCLDGCQPRPELLPQVPGARPQDGAAGDAPGACAVATAQDAA